MTSDESTTPANERSDARDGGGSGATKTKDAVECQRFFALSKRVPRDVKRFCGICRQHGLQLRTRGHVCAYKDCDCAKCSLVRSRRQVMSQQIRLRRAQDKRFQRTNEPAEADLVPMLTSHLCKDLVQGDASPNNNNVCAISAAPVIDGNASPLAIASADASDLLKDAVNNMCYFCQKCKNHGILVWKKLHKRLCPYANCKCRKCDLIEIRRNLDQNIKTRRAPLKRATSTNYAAEAITTTATTIIESVERQRRQQQSKQQSQPQSNDNDDDCENKKVCAHVVSDALRQSSVAVTLPRVITTSTMTNGAFRTNTSPFTTSATTRSPSISTTSRCSPSTSHAASTPSSQWELNAPLLENDSVMSGEAFNYDAILSGLQANKCAILNGGLNSANPLLMGLRGKSSATANGAEFMNTIFRTFVADTAKGNDFSLEGITERQQQEQEKLLSYSAAPNLLQYIGNINEMKDDINKISRLELSYPAQPTVGELPLNGLTMKERECTNTVACNIPANMVTTAPSVISPSALLPSSLFLNSTQDALLKKSLSDLHKLNELMYYEQQKQQLFSLQKQQFQQHVLHEQQQQQEQQIKMRLYKEQQMILCLKQQEQQQITLLQNQQQQQQQDHEQQRQQANQQQQQNEACANKAQQQLEQFIVAIAQKNALASLMGVAPVL